MAAPVITISPAGAGVVTPTSLYQYSGIPSAETEHHFIEGGDELLFYTTPNYGYDIDIYKLTATPAAGYAFDHFEFVTRDWQSRGQSIVYEETLTGNNSHNPAISNGLTPIGFYQWAASIVGSFTITPPASDIVSHLDPVSVTAVFRPLHTPTNLLVNSYSRVLPVRLVYDDRPNGTGKLIADY
jgi:hypothetical protein